MRLTLYNFKNYADKKIDLRESLQVIVGNNGSGKSTLCEALSILVNASNPHHTKWDEKSSFHRASAGGNEDFSWALRLQHGEDLFQTIFDGNSRSPKWSINEQSKTKKAYEEKMPYRAFWIQSDHLRVISGEPSERRNFLDDMLVFASPVYDKIVKNYRTALTSRNKVIQSILDREATKSDLSIWNSLLADTAVQVISERRKFFTWLEDIMNNEKGIMKNGGIGINSPSFGGASGEVGEDKIKNPQLGTLNFPFSVVDENKSELLRRTNELGTFLNLPGPVKIELLERHPLEAVTKEHFLNLLQEYTERDLVVGRTTIGPHLDEILFQVSLNDSWQPTKYILSRGENKILLLAFIRLLGKYVEEVSGKKPFFLLDDVLSELDTDHTHILCQLFSDALTIMTTQPNHTGGLPEGISRVDL